MIFILHLSISVGINPMETNEALPVRHQWEVRRRRSCSARRCCCCSAWLRASKALSVRVGAEEEVVEAARGAEEVVVEAAAEVAAARGVEEVVVGARAGGMVVAGEAEGARATRATVADP
jgi:hypothetical protein